MLVRGCRYTSPIADPIYSSHEYDMPKIEMVILHCCAYPVSHSTSQQLDVDDGGTRDPAEPTMQYTRLLARFPGSSRHRSHV